MEDSSKDEIKSDSKLIYSTYSVCPKCALIERKGLDWQPATVIERNGRIFLVAKCKTHGDIETLYCSNPEFFKKTLSFNFDLPGTEVPATPDIEDIKAKLKYTPQSANLPLALELPLWENGDFVSDKDLKQRIDSYKALYPPTRQFVLKVLAKLAMDIPILNSKLIYVESLISGNMILLEASYERLVLLCREENSIFLKPNVYPSLKYFLKQGDEQLCMEELLNLFQELKAYAGIQLMVTLCLSRPYPTLNDLLRFMREQYGFIRMVVISMERSPKELVESLAKNDANPSLKLDKGIPLNAVESVDVYELLEHIQKCSRNTMTVDDFFPASIAAMLEPFLTLMGYGFYFMRPSAFCGYIACMVNTEKSFTSYPVSRLFDFEKLFNDMKPVLPRLQDGKIGIMNAKKLKKIFMDCANPNKGPLPDLYEYLTDKTLADDTRKFIQNLQFFVVHNNMDIAAVDMVRRCNCAMGTRSSLSEGHIASYCTGCI